MQQDQLDSATPWWEEQLPVLQPYGRRTLAAIMQKGGVGKTATTIGLASDLARKGIPVVVVDMCHTGAATASLGVDFAEGPVNLAAALLGTIDVPVYDLMVQHSPNLWVIPHGVDMVTVHEDLAPKKYREERLRMLLDDLPTRAVVIIDCPPVLDVRTDNALTAAGQERADEPEYGGVLLCVELTMYAMRTLALLRAQVTALNKLARYTIAEVGWFASITNKRTNVDKRARAHINTLDLEPLGEMPRRTVIADARDEGKTVAEFRPNGDGAEVLMLWGLLGDKIRRRLHV